MRDFCSSLRREFGENGFANCRVDSIGVNSENR
jgi:hypothetical protein